MLEGPDKADQETLPSRDKDFLPTHTLSL